MQTKARFLAETSMIDVLLSPQSATIWFQHPLFFSSSKLKVRAWRFWLSWQGCYLASAVTSLPYICHPLIRLRYLILRSFLSSIALIPLMPFTCSSNSIRAFTGCAGPRASSPASYSPLILHIYLVDATDRQNNVVDAFTRSRQEIAILHLMTICHGSSIHAYKPRSTSPLHGPRPEAWERRSQQTMHVFYENPWWIRWCGHSRILSIVPFWKIPCQNLLLTLRLFLGSSDGAMGSKLQTIYCGLV